MQTHQETEPFLKSGLTVMALENLPGELPRDSSFDFGEKLLNVLMPELLPKDKSEMIEGAKILSKGKLTK